MRLQKRKVFVVSLVLVFKYWVLRGLLHFVLSQAEVA